MEIFSYTLLRILIRIINRVCTFTRLKLVGCLWRFSSPWRSRGESARRQTCNFYLNSSQKNLYDKSFRHLFGFADTRHGFYAKLAYDDTSLASASAIVWNKLDPLI